MKLLVKVAILVAVLLLSVPLAYADGTLQYSTCGTEEVLGIDGSPVAAGSRVELWDTNTGQVVDTAQIGEGIIGSPSGRFVKNATLPDGAYSLKLRVFNSATPDGSAASCAVVVGDGGRGTAGVDISISPDAPQDICFDTAQIPDQRYVPGEGGCSVSATCPDFEAPQGVGSEDLQAIIAHWRKDDTDPNWESEIQQFDVKPDGHIDVADVTYVTAAWDTTCP